MPVGRSRWRDWRVGVDVLDAWVATSNSCVPCFLCGREFYEAYHHYIPAEPDFEARQEVYRLYHILHHL